MLPGFAASQNLRLVGRSDLGGAGLNGNVAVVGTTAIVGAGITPAAGVHAHLYNPYPCPSVSVKVVDLSLPSRPEVIATIPVPAGVAALPVRWSAEAQACPWMVSPKIRQRYPGRVQYADHVPGMRQAQAERSQASSNRRPASTQAIRARE